MTDSGQVAALQRESDLARDTCGVCLTVLTMLDQTIEYLAATRELERKPPHLIGLEGAELSHHVGMGADLLHE